MFAKTSDGSKLVLGPPRDGWLEWCTYDDRIELGPVCEGSPVVLVAYPGLTETGVRGRDVDEAIRNAEAAWELV